VLDRHGLVERRGRVRHRAQGTALSLGQRPNELWCTDYKGEFLLGNQQYCYPLTVTDHASRFLFTCEALSSTREDYASLNVGCVGGKYAAAIQVFPFLEHRTSFSPSGPPRGCCGSTSWKDSKYNIAAHRRSACVVPYRQSRTAASVAGAVMPKYYAWRNYQVKVETFNALRGVNFK
jgi:hypothetical protein